MKKSFCLFIVLIKYTVFLGQAPDIQWQKSFGGSVDDYGYSILQTADNGYMIFGTSDSNNGQISGSHGGRDYWLVKTDATGTILWQKTYGGSNSDQGGGIIPTTDGGYILSGYSESINGDVTGNHGLNDIWIVKINSTGVIQWQKSLGGSGSELGVDVKQTTDGGYIVFGLSNSNNGDVTNNNGGLDYWLVKLNSLGTLQWQNNFGGSGSEASGTVEQTADGGYILSGYTTSTDGDITGYHGGYADNWVVKTNSVGQMEWQKTYGGSKYERLNDIKRTPDGGYILAGRTNSIDGDVTFLHGIETDCWIVKINSLGSIEWQKTYGGTNFDDTFSIQLTNDNGYIFAGMTGSYNGDVTSALGNYDGWVVKLSNNGTLEWQKSIGGNSVDVIHYIQQTSDDWYIAVGYTGGNIPGYYGGGTDYYVCKLGPNLNTTELEKDSIQLYPNPTTTRLFINSPKEINESVFIFDELGKTIHKTIKNNTIDVSELESGIYFIEIQLEDNSKLTKKFIKQ